MKALKHLLLLTIGISFLAMGLVISMAQDEHDMEMDPALIERGQELFTINACVGCHGPNAEGTDVGPALAGHTEFQVRRQVRSPAGIMLVFSPTQIPEEDLQALVAYIHSLEPVEGEAGHDMHEMGGITTGDIIFGHHWLLWLELEMGDIEGSIHHTAHIIELTEGPHQAAMQPVLTALGEGDVDAAKAIVEPMVTDVGEFSHDIYTIGLQLVHMATSANDQEVAHHFALDLSQHELTEEQEHTVSEVLEHIEACDLAGASMMIEMELGEDVNFIPEGMGMEMDEDMHMEGDEHSEEAMDMSSDEHSEDMEMATEEAHNEDMDMSSDEHSEEETDMSSTCGEEHTEESGHSD